MHLPPPPARFVEATGVKWARLMRTAPAFTVRLRRPTGRRLQGVKYEKTVHEMLYKLYPDAYVASPWLYFEGLHGVKWCQPDGLLFDVEAGVVTIVEVKYQHTTDAWWQLRRLYEPVVRELFPEPLWRVKVVTVVKWFDPAVEWPEPLQLVRKVGVGVLHKTPMTEVLVFNGKEF